MKLLSSPLIRYRIMAWIVGVMLIAVFVTIPFQKVDGVLGPIHGVLYIVYLVTVVNMLISYRVGLWYFVGMVVAGWCPFVSFICERLISRKLAARTEATPTGPTAPGPEGGGYTVPSPGTTGTN